MNTIIGEIGAAVSHAERDLIQLDHNEVVELLRASDATMGQAEGMGPSDLLTLSAARERLAAMLDA
ncbi:hypothetical protein CCC_03120 [Paramagnetospirillum magnetotacticum MS-1]|uniref:Uncharacterized protein n=1 Tax=Paramagnetospirillum magnetotacticum MS-1 TaxID=272627 RepID=A0A0C2UG65_PARME|nr:hypothetical protein [Paramagnetospirillum magnetotacticum]KIM00518.1 hypothetical protein CCC_03120 [Paramagnetospirillum magnetotacticum MS-1]